MLKFSISDNLTDPIQVYIQSYFLLRSYSETNILNCYLSMSMKAIDKYLLLLL